MTKGEMRREAKARLRSLGPAERARAGEAIARLVWTLPGVAAARVILLYASLPEEVPTDAIAAEARRRGIAVAYPRCLPGTREMALHRVDAVGELRGAGGYGIREPRPTCPAVEAEAVDAALVPGLGWDRAGRRLGRGAGYYDRLFSRPGWRGFRCGLFFSVQEFAEVPVDPWDAPLDAVVTEGEVRITNDEL